MQTKPLVASEVKGKSHPQTVDGCQKGDTKPCAYYHARSVTDRSQIHKQLQPKTIVNNTRQRATKVVPPRKKAIATDFARASSIFRFGEVLCDTA